MLTLNDGRSELWQWDTGRKLTVDADCTQVHFSNKFFGRSVDVDVVDGVAEIPDVLLQADKELLVWAFVGTAENGYTKISKVFKVNKRNKPADYVFTPTEQTTLDEIMKRLDRIEEGQDPDAIKNAVDEYLANNPIQVEEKDPTVPVWAKQPTKPKYTADEVGAVATVNGQTPDENGNVEIEVPEASEPDLTGYATERYVQENYQPKGDYLTEVPEGYATEEFVKNKIAEAELGGEEVDLSGYAQKSELPTKVSQLQNDSGYLTAVPDGYAKTEDIPKNPADIGAQPAGNYALKTDIPSVPVRSVNGKTGAVKLSASDVGARPDNWMPTASDVGALSNTYTPPNQTAEQVGADPVGTAASAVSTHNTADDSHGDLRLELKAINDRLTAFFDSDNQTLDELSEIVAYITSNKSLIDAITTSKVNVADITNNLTTNVANKPLSAAQGVALKGLIDAVSNSLSNYQTKGDYALASAIPTKVSQLQNDKGYLTEHQDISGKLDADKLPEAVNAALAQAKASGEFDGADGSPGQDGQNGSDGVGIASIKQTTTSTVDGGNNVFTVTLTNGATATFTVKNGSKGSTGATGAAGKNGAAGKTPVRGVDYYTEADKAEIVAMVIESLGGNPVFGYVDENNNIVVSGNLPDGTYSVKYEMENGSKVNIGNLVIDTNVYYTVKNTLTNCTSNNSATQAIGGQSYSAIITAKSGYELKSIVVKMGGTDISSTAVSGGKITIANVTGNIVITAIAEAQASRTNFFDASSGFYGRLSSSGADRTDSTVLYVTNYIAVQKGDVVEISGCCLGATNIAGAWYSSGYNASKANVHSDNTYASNSYWTVDAHTTANAQLTVLSDSIKYFRFTLGHTDGKSKVDTNTVIINIKRNGQWL